MAHQSSDQVLEKAQIDRTRKLHSLLELGQLIGLDLQLSEMLLKIAEKAVEVMDADRCSLFLHDSQTNELWSTVALGMGEQVIRIPSGAGLAGYCFKSGEVVNLKDVYTDPRFNKEIDSRSGYRTKSLLCMPLFNRAGERLGVIQLLNKKDGIFTEEDEIFLQTFGNHASVFIEIAQLQKARIDALEESRAELERLNRAKNKALDHLSHELRTPLSIIQGNLRIMKRRLQQRASESGKIFETLEKHLNRLLDIQQETDKIIRTYQKTSEETILLYPFIEQILGKTKELSSHRDLEFYLEGAKDLQVYLDPQILEPILEGILKNAIENTPDKGTIKILLERGDKKSLLKIQDFGVGITGENQKAIFDGLFHTQETDLYTSKEPYDFGAGGKGLDLHRIKIYGQRFGFDLSLESRRCTYLPTDRDLCPGKISACPRCRETEDCLSSGGSTFCLSFRSDS